MRTRIIDPCLQKEEHDRGVPYTDWDMQAHRTPRILLVYRLAEHRLRTRLAETKQTIPNQLNKPTARPTMRWVFQCFEGIEILHIHSTVGTQSLILCLQPVHRLVLMLLGLRKNLQSLFMRLRNVGYKILLLGK